MDAVIVASFWKLQPRPWITWLSILGRAKRHTQLEDSLSGLRLKDALRTVIGGGAHLRLRQSQPPHAFPTKSIARIHRANVARWRRGWLCHQAEEEKPNPHTRKDESQNPQVQTANLGHPHSQEWLCHQVDQTGRARR